MRTLSIDIETYSPADLPSVGVYRYAAAPGFQVLLFAYAFDDEAVAVVDTTREELPDEVLFALMDPNVEKHAFNASFERVCLSRYVGLPEGQYLDPAQWRCTMVQAAYYGAIGGLANVARFLKVPVEKDAAGTRLINKFSKPQKKPPAREGEDWERFMSYCVRDVEVERAIATDFPGPLPEEEQAVYVADQRINDRGVRIDRTLAAAACDMAEADAHTAKRRLAEVTGLANPNSVGQLLGWLQGRGCAIENCARATLEAELARPDLDADAREAIELRLGSAKASVKKYIVARDAPGTDDRLRGSFMFYGAATGRWCLTGDHEVLTCNGWVPLDSWRGGEIAVWNADTETVSFQSSRALRFEYEGPMVEIESKRVSQLSTPDHKMAVWDDTRGWTARTVRNMRAREKVPYTGYRRVQTAPDPLELRILVMTQADGHYTREGALRFRFKRERKIERCKHLLRRAGMTHICQSNKDGSVSISIRACHLPAYLRFFRDKTFGWWILNEDLEVFFEELELWDGSRSSDNSMQYVTTNRHNAEIVQTFAHLSGRASCIAVKHRDTEDWSTAYCVNVWHRPGNRNELRSARKEIPFSGMVYCAETPTGFFLVRRNRKIWVTGNSGRLMQLQNLPRGSLSGEDLDAARALVRQGDAEAVRLLYGDVQGVLKSLVRTTLVPEDGHLFAVADYSAIEARVLAWLAGEEWVLEVFRGDGKVYEATASRMFGVPIEQVDKALRAKGKVATLALGYQGGPAALERMGALEAGIPKDELPKIVRMWRNANPRIKGLWPRVEQAARDALLGRGPSRVCMGRVRVRKAPEVRGFAIELPSGRELFYRNAKVRDEDLHITYEVCSKGAGVQTVETYGGRLVENITQAVARDLLAASLERVEGRGYRPVAHVHDEVVCEVPEADAEACLDGIRNAMCVAPAWAEKLPLDADGYMCQNYRKE